MTLVANWIERTWVPSEWHKYFAIFRHRSHLWTEERWSTGKLFGALRIIASIFWSFISNYKHFITQRFSSFRSHHVNSSLACFPIFLPHHWSMCVYFYAAVYVHIYGANSAFTSFTDGFKIGTEKRTCCSVLSALWAQVTESSVT